jgi:hypothetical protein
MPTAISALYGVGSYIHGGVYEQTWNATVSGRGHPMAAPHLPDKNIQLQGPTGGTSRIIMEGTNGSVASTATWITLRSVTDGAIDSTNVTGGLFFQPRGNPRMIRPHFETVTAGKTLSVIVIAK